MSSLYLISTPIGNLKDITLRAIETINSLDLLFCENVKVSKTLLFHYNLQPRKVSLLNEFNRQTAIPLAIATLMEGKAVGLISDAGTPLISDPGQELVAEAKSREINIVPIPGASSILASLVASGLPTKNFTFVGFPPRTKTKRNSLFSQWLSYNGTLIIFESPHRIKESLKSMLEIFGEDTPIVIAREVTKVFEEFISGKLGDIQDEESSLSRMKIKGELVVLLYLSGKRNFLFTDLELKTVLSRSLAQDSKSAKSVVQAIHLMTGLSKKHLYDLVLEIKNNHNSNHNSKNKSKSKSKSRDSKNEE